ncbi:MAG: hypothetical protein N2606_01055 [Candidatus Omnitrophica bacterium]|nr:hypothetical protein [Candidatus Omnitrophota bacterium]
MPIALFIALLSVLLSSCISVAGRFSSKKEQVLQGNQTRMDNFSAELAKKEEIIQALKSQLQDCQKKIQEKDSKIQELKDRLKTFGVF